MDQPHKRNRSGISADAKAKIHKAGMANLVKGQELKRLQGQVKAVLEMGATSGTTTLDDKNIKPDISEALARFKARRALRPRTERYLDSIESVRDFEKVRKEHPRWALEFAADRVWGKPKSNDAGGQGSQRIDVKALVLVLSGGQGAGPQDIGIDGQALTFIDLPAVEGKDSPSGETKEVKEIEQANTDDKSSG